jgi:hypothetical protein
MGGLANTDWRWIYARITPYEDKGDKCGKGNLGPGTKPIGLRLGPAVELDSPKPASAVDEVEPGGLTSVYGKSPVGRQGVRPYRRVARPRRCGASVEPSQNPGRP